jgi:AGCS family alanine or glycine:cation symporter
MESITTILNSINGYVWGPVTLFLLVGTGLYLTIGLGFMPMRKLGTGFKLLWQGRSEDKDEGDISPFNALMTAMSATVGTGNIVGVAGAIAIGGPGAVFWMWITALVGMATKYSEAVLAVKYREVDERGKHQGGPMYYIKNGLGKNWTWMAFLFALFGALAAFGIGNGVQSNAVATNLSTLYGVPTWLTGVILSVLVAAVIIGGVHRIGAFAGKIVPFMAIFYVGGALLIILTNISAVPTAIGFIFKDAFTGSAAVGGFVGSSIMIAIQTGVARGLFSNEAGLGTAPIAHAAAKTKDPVKQGTIGMLGTFLDTIVICTMTALVIVIMNGWSQLDPETGKLMSKAAITSYSFSQGLAGYGHYIVTLGMIFFTFTTIIGWSFYGERCAEYIFGIKVIIFYRILWVAVVFIGTTLKLDVVWIIAEILNGLMAIPNLIGLLLLSPVIFKLTRDYYAKN